MKITVMTSDEQFLTLDVDPDESVENLKALLEFEATVSLHQQKLHFNGKELNNSDRLSGVGVKDGDMMMMLSVTSRVNNDSLRLNPDGSAVNPSAFQQHICDDPESMARLVQADPPMSQAILGDDLDRLRNLLQCCMNAINRDWSISVNKKRSLMGLMKIGKLYWSIILKHLHEW